MQKWTAPALSALVAATLASLSSARPATAAPSPAAPLPAGPVDVVVYGGTSGGVAAAVAAARAGKSVVLVEPTRHLGGLSSGGLGWTDLGNPAAIGGLSREFYHRVWQHYQTDAAWGGGAAAKAAFSKAGGQGTRAMNDETQLMWVFEPHVAENVYDDLVAEAKVPVAFGERLDLKAGVKKDGKRVTAITAESGKTFAASVFIDASYEGDLMALAGVSFAVGREANAQYGETINGIQAAKGTKNQLPAGIDPYVVKGDPKSGLLPGVNATAGGTDGSGDARIQAYCYRMCLTDAPENRITVAKPAGYDEKQFELVFRAIEAGQKDKFFKLDLMPNRKTDSNNATGLSTDYIGFNYAYPAADHATREQIAKAHELWQRGLIWTIQNHPRVPKEIREKWAKWGLPKDEFPDAGGWARQLYVREARRMVGEVVATERTLRNDASVTRPVGMGSYAMDSHNAQRYVDDKGHVRNEGDVQIGVPRPYRVDYGSLVPKAAECENLIVPVCLSATHIAYGSIRMEPVFMVLGESAGVAAGLAVDGKTSVQAVPYERLKGKLEAAKQVLALPDAPVKDGAKKAEPKKGEKKATAAPAGPATVICFGDSITAGGAYPRALAAALGTDVANAGVSGQTSAAALPRLERDVLARKPAVVVILFGTNDSRLDEPRVRVPVDAYAANLTKMVEACQAAGAKVVVCTVPPIDPGPYFTRHKPAAFEAAGGLPAVLDTYRAAARQVAGARGAAVVDLGAELPKDPAWATADGVHPTEAAARVLAGRVAAAVRPLLPATGAAPAAAGR